MIILEIKLFLVEHRMSSACIEFIDQRDSFSSRHKYYAGVMLGGTSNIYLKPHTHSK